MNNNVNIDYGDKFGYSEMFEWGENVDPNISKLCKFVQFSKEYPRAVVLAKDETNIIGITSISPAYTASNPSEWPYKYLFNEYGDLFLEEKTIGAGRKVYDPVKEMSYMKTYKDDILLPITNSSYDSNKKYITRDSRQEWVHVSILGKAIVEDSGDCTAGDYCGLYIGDDNTRFGTVIPYDEKLHKNKYYVLERLSEHTILILIK